ncbi:MAG: hypothetical protein P0Y53_02325 [Candidatus Pseudobacter hemicellulosilyticus]|uniref:Tetratricopeptide repeat protein n=1 Tax=Candidatus Pseudobacter hemicellulosilyticus TaxID=3121375 RepID=A0AAJ5WT67_9BACT|nr:MAG: hypothetical protein P0Y53_02325 [Pseudobacter sp.]
MKKYAVLTALLFCFLLAATAQSKSKQKAKEAEKPPTQKEMEEMMKEVQQMMGEMEKEMSPEDKKMMDSMGIKMPDMKNMKMPAMTDKQLAQAWEDENRIVPKKDAARIAAIPQGVTTARMPAYISAVHQKVLPMLQPKVVTAADKVQALASSKGISGQKLGNVAALLWADGRTQIALYLMGKVCATAPGADNLSNYASMLSMMGAEQLAIPLLTNLNTKYPRNSTLLNNLGQAWFGLGELDKAGKYLDSATALFPYHPQANLTKSRIQESKGETAKAAESVRKSMKYSYSQEKEERLRKLGHELSANDFKIPGQRKPDPMNLGGFRAPAFPMSVDQCVILGEEWKAFYEQIDAKMDQLQKLRAQLYETAMQNQAKRAQADISMVKAAMSNPGAAREFVSVPMYAARASIKYNAYAKLYSGKLESLAKRTIAFSTGELKRQRDAYEAIMAKLREEDLEQTGEGKPNKDFCPQYKEASDKFLKAVNPTMASLYMEYLQLHKELLNESAYWNMYIQWADMFEVLKKDFQVEWLKALKNSGLSGGTGLPFVYIPEFVCKKQEEKKGKSKLQEFDDVACNYNSMVDFVIVSIETNCSHSTTRLKTDLVEYTHVELGDEYLRSTLVLRPKAGVDGNIGPLKVGASVGADITVNMDRDGVKDWEGTVKAGTEVGVGRSIGPVKGEATIGTAIEVEIDGTGVKEVNLVNTAQVEVGIEAPNPNKSSTIDRINDGIKALDTSVKIGIEDRVSLISGHGSVSGTGALKGITLSQW